MMINHLYYYNFFSSEAAGRHLVQTKMNLFVFHQITRVHLLFRAMMIFIHSHYQTLLRF